MFDVLLRWCNFTDLITFFTQMHGKISTVFHFHTVIYGEIKDTKLHLKYRHQVAACWQHWREMKAKGMQNNVRQTFQYVSSVSDWVCDVLIFFFFIIIFKLNNVVVNGCCRVGAQGCLFNFDGKKWKTSKSKSVTLQPFWANTNEQHRTWNHHHHHHQHCWANKTLPWADSSI